MLVIIVMVWPGYEYLGRLREGQGTATVLAVCISSLVVIPLYFRQTFVVAGLLLLAGRWIEGVAATRLVSVIVGFGGGSGGIESKVRQAVVRRFRRGLITVFLIVLVGWSVLFVVLFFRPDLPFTYTVSLLWTVVIALLSILGLVWKFSRVDSEVYSDFPPAIPIIAGLILAIAGAEIYNFQLFTIQFAAGPASMSLSAVEPILFVCSSIVYAMGFWWSASKRLSVRH